LWTLPGGYADVGLSAAENVEKEILEEAGIEVKASFLYNLRHKAKGGFPPDVRDFYKLYFICEACNDDPVVSGLETIDAGYFAKEELPPLSLGRVIEEDLIIAWNFSESNEKKTLFD